VVIDDFICIVRHQHQLTFPLTCPALLEASLSCGDVGTILLFATTPTTSGRCCDREHDTELRILYGYARVTPSMSAGCRRDCTGLDSRITHGTSNLQRSMCRSVGDVRQAHRNSPTPGHSSLCLLGRLRYRKISYDPAPPYVICLTCLSTLTCGHDADQKLTFDKIQLISCFSLLIY
jgi:hypothetical protein